MLTKTKKNCQNFNFQNFKNPKRFFVKTIEKIIQEKLDKVWQWFVEKITSALNDPQMTLNPKSPKVPYICWNTTRESQISLRFALRSLVFHVIEASDFYIGYNGKFEILGKKILKKWKLKISKIPIVVVWGNFKTFGCDL